MCAFSSPVDFQFCANSFWERLPMTVVTTPATGTESSATSASVGEIQNIMASTPITMSSEFSSCERVCCSVCDTLSMSLVTRLSTSPRACLSK